MLETHSLLASLGLELLGKDLLDEGRVQGAVADEGVEEDPLLVCGDSLCQREVPSAIASCGGSDQGHRFAIGSSAIG